MSMFDSFGLMVQRDGDGGDTYARHMGARFAQKLRRNLPPIIDFPNERSKDLRLLTLDRGVYIRHPSVGPKERPWNDPKNFSRDQTIPGLLEFGASRDYRRLWDSLWSHLKRGLFCQNGTDTMIGHMGVYVRAFRLYPLWPILALLDVMLFINVLGRCGVIPRYKHEIGQFVPLDPDDVGDDLLLIQMFMQARAVMPTPISWLAWKYYVKFRPINYGCYLFGIRMRDMGLDDAGVLNKAKKSFNSKATPDCHPIIGALRWYCRPTANGHLEFADLHTDVLFGLNMLS